MIKHPLDRGSEPVLLVECGYNYGDVWLHRNKDFMLVGRQLNVNSAFGQVGGRFAAFTLWYNVVFAIAG